MCNFASEFNQFSEMRKVIFVFAALMMLAACGNRQAAHEAESGEMSNRAAPDDTYANGISIEELFEVAKEEDSGKLKEILTRKGFAVDNNQDERYDCDSEKWKKTVYNPERTDSDTISVYWTSATIYSGREVDIVVSCHKDEIMDGWISIIRGMGFSLEDVFEREDSKRMAYSKEDHRGSVIDYDLISNKKSINILTEFDPQTEGLFSR